MKSPHRRSDAQDDWEGVRLLSELSIPAFRVLDSRSWRFTEILEYLSFVHSFLALCFWPTCSCAKPRPAPKHQRPKAQRAQRPAQSLQHLHPFFSGFHHCTQSVSLHLYLHLFSLSCTCPSASRIIHPAMDFYSTQPVWLIHGRLSLRTGRRPFPIGLLFLSAFGPWRSAESNTCTSTNASATSSANSTCFCGGLFLFDTNVNVHTPRILSSVVLVPLSRTLMLDFVQVLVRLALFVRVFFTSS